jgi:hypothetical protein
MASAEINGMVDLLQDPFGWLERKAAPEVDGMTLQEHEVGQEGRSPICTADCVAVSTR